MDGASAAEALPIVINVLHVGAGEIPLRHALSSMGAEVESFVHKDLPSALSEGCQPLFNRQIEIRYSSRRTWVFSNLYLLITNRSCFSIHRFLPQSTFSNIKKRSGERDSIVWDIHMKEV